MKDLIDKISKLKTVYLVICMLFCSAIQTISAQVSPQERQALIDFYNATGGDNWANTIAANQPWLVNDTSSLVSDWFGVTVVDSKVMQLSLSGNSLNGTLLSSFGDLIHLTFLNLGINSLNGSLPDSIGNIVNLETLQCTRNAFTGGIPTSIGNLTKLIYVNFAINQLTEPLPDTFDNLVNVETFTLERNAITGVIPTSIGAMSALKVLNLGSNQFAGEIPVAIGNLSNLTTLNLFINKLNSSIPSELGNLTNLTHLNLFSNLLTGEIPTNLGNLSSLLFFNLYRNQLTGSIPSELGNLSSLTQFNVYNNVLTGEIPADLGNLSNLTHLNLFSNSLSGKIPSTIGNLTKLIILNAYRNQLSGSIPSELSNLPSLTTLGLSTNDLSGSVPESLATLALSGVFNTFTVDNNSFVFSDFETEFATYKSELTTFNYLIQDKVDKVEARIVSPGNSITLTSTSLTSDNNTYQWYKDNIAINGATSKDLVIDDAADTDAGAYYFTATNSVIPDLILSRNLITVSVEEDTCGVSNEEKQALLDFYEATNGDNWTNTLANNQPWSEGTFVCDWYGVIVVDGKITGLNLENNGLQGTIPASISKLQYLTVLNLSNNTLTGEIPSSIGSMIELQTLLLYHNNFTGGLPPSLGSLMNLETMDFSFNTIQGPVPIEYCNLLKLKTLNLSDNQLSGELPYVIESLTSLETLDLRNNGFSGIIPTGLARLSRLQFLGITNNYFSGTIPISLIETSNLEAFLFENNNFIFSDFIDKHNGYVNYLNVAYAYQPQAKTDEIEEKTVTVDDEVIFTTVLDNEFNSYQWYKDDTPIVGANSREHKITNAIVADAGEYYVVTTNSVIIGLTLERNIITLSVDETCDVQPSERQALIDLYNATNGANWTNTLASDQPWLIDDQTSLVCNWHGISVENNTVVGLNLSANQLSGTLVDIFSDLPALKTLVISTNKLEGNIPLSLAAVETVTINSNDFVFTDLEAVVTSFSSISFNYIPQNNVDTIDEIAINYGDPVTLVTSDRLYSANNQYQWYKGNGELISGATSKTLVLENTIEETSGIYYLEATNSTIPGLTIKRNPITLTVRAEGDTCGVSEEERQLLIDLYTSTNGPNWTNTWDVSTPVCDWYGVTVIEDRVAELNLVNNNLEGTINSSLTELSELTELSLSNNNISGEIHSSVNQLVSLKILDLSGNQFSGTIPEELGLLTNLSSLFLSNNELIGAIPASFGNLVNLASLRVDNNNLSGIIPVEIKQLINLSSFAIFDNEFIFEEIEPEFIFLKNKLGTEFMYDTQEKVDQEETISILIGQSLKLSSDRLVNQNNTYQWYKKVGAVYEAIAGEISKELVIEDVTSDIAGAYILRATNSVVIGLTLERYPITVEIVPAGSCNVSEEDRQALIDFYTMTNGSNWTNTIAGDRPWLINDPDANVCDWYGVTIGQNFTIEKIELPTNNLRGELPESLKKLVDLKVLNLAQNNIVGVIPTTIDRLRSLEVLNLRENIIVGIIPEEVCNLSNLVTLDLGVNDFCKCAIIPENIGKLQKLVYLDLSEDNLKEGIPEGLWTIPFLETIKIQDNMLSGGISSSIGNLSNLKTFWVSQNSFSGPIPNTITTIPGLYSLHLNSNAFGGDIPQLLQNLDILNSDVQIQNNRFVFSDFEPEHPDYVANFDTYVYSPQAKVDSTIIIEVELGESARLFTEALTSANNTYQWIFEGDDLIETTLREINIDNITESDLGDYYFTATNSTIDGLVLMRRTITLKLPDDTTDPGGGGTTNVFCLSQSTLTIADLESPIDGVTEVLWFLNQKAAELEEPTSGDIEEYLEWLEQTTSNFNDEPLDPTTQISENYTYWAKGPSSDVRVPLFVDVHNGIEGFEVLDVSYQFFSVLLNAKIADLEPKNQNIQWYTEASNGTPIISSDALIDGQSYFGQQGDNPCRFEVAVAIGTAEPQGDQVQTFCESSLPTVEDLKNRYTLLDSHEIIFYKEATGNAQYLITDMLDSNTEYFLAQKDTLGNESLRKKVLVVLYIIPEPIISNTNQVFYTNDPVFVSDLVAVGDYIRWYDAPFDGTAYDDTDRLISGGTYYAAQLDFNCASDQGDCCMSVQRVAVNVTIFEELPPSLIGCERFRPQPGDRYVISGWVRENGMEAINPQVINFDNVSDVFVDMLNYLLDNKIMTEEENQRHIPALYELESRDYDGLIPFIKNAVDKTLKIYNFQYIKEQLYGEKPERTIGFSFALEPSANAIRFEYKTPFIRFRLPVLPQIGTITSPFRYQLFHNPTLSLEFTKAEFCGGNNNICLTSSFSISGTDRTGGLVYDYSNPEEVTTDFSTGLIDEYTKSSYILDPNYQVMEYTNSLIAIEYAMVNDDGDLIPLDSSTITFKPKGNIIDGWQRISADFTIPLDATNMTIGLKNKLVDPSTANLNVYFDDVRIHPFVGNMKSFVYDPITQRLLSEQDENNYGTYYEYDQEGGLIRVKKETEKGIYTIQETRSGNSKLNK